MDENPIQEKSTKTPIQQTKGSRMPKNEEERMNLILKNHIQRNKWKRNNNKSLFGVSICQW